jgi:hypothetical protein
VTLSLPEGASDPSKECQTEDKRGGEALFFGKHGDWGFMIYDLRFMI